MRKRLSDATTRGKEVREFPIGVSGRRLRVSYAKCAGCFERHNQITLPKRKVDTMLNAIRRFVKEEEGASAAEYALLLALITGAIALLVQGLGTAIGGALTAATNAITGS